MPWTTPETFTAGQTLTAASMNIISGDISYLKPFTNFQQTVVTAVDGIANSTTYADIPGLSVTITPTAADSRVLVRVHVCIGYSAATQTSAKLLRGTTVIGGGVTASNRQGVFVVVYGNDNGRLDSFDYAYLDSPATTSATTYKVQMNAPSATVYLNKSGADTDNTTTFRGVSVISAQEIPA